MNKLELTCLYCNFSWEINYKPNENIYCTQCGDRNIKVIDIARDKIDYYQGSPEFPSKTDDDWTFKG